MQKLIYVPPRGDLEKPDTCVELSLSPPYILGSVTGTGGPGVTVLSSTVPGADGVYVQGVRLESRPIKCVINVKGDSREDMYRKRARLVGLLTPSSVPGTLYYVNDFTTLRISAIPTDGPEFVGRIKNYCRAEVTIFCPDPHWESPEECSGYMAYLDEGFTFPFEFDIQFAALANKAGIVNNGSVPVPLEIRVKGPATNPAVVNDTTGEYIRLSSTLEEGETLAINTRRGSKSVVITHADGTAEDAYHYIDPRSVFFQLAPGNNDLRYQSDNESEQTQVTLRYHELYTGV